VPLDGITVFDKAKLVQIGEIGLRRHGLIVPR
jgi:hypothetical protein